MKNYFRIIYLYIISAITLSMIVGGTISAVNAMTEYKYPTSVYDYNTYDAEYKTAIELNEEKESIERRKYNDSVESLRNFFTSVAVIVVGTPLYIYHWGRIEKERKEMEE